MTARADQEAFATFRAAYEAGRPQMVWRRVVADTETPVSAYLKLADAATPSFLLESVEGGTVRGRYSLIGLAPDLIWRANGGSSEINRQAASAPDAFSAAGPPLDSLRALVAECAMQTPADLPPVLACLVGYFSYESAGLVERLPMPRADPIGLPDMLFIRPSLILVFDRLSDQLFLVAPVFPVAQGAAERPWMQAHESIEAALDRLAGPLPNPENVRLAAPGAEVVTPVLTAGAYQARVRRAQDYIAAGDIFQVVLAQRFTMAFPLPPFELYRSLRRINPSPFLYYLNLPAFQLIGSSPEILVRVRDGEVTVRPIAGTRPRGRTAGEDDSNRADLLADPKERAEHLMLLDLGRNDVGRVASPGSVSVTDRFAVEFYSHVMHIVSNVRGRLAVGRDAIDALLAGFPAGTVSGAPKLRAMEIINELEPERRGAYAGGVGYFAPDGSMDSCIVLRTAVLKEGVMHVQAGAGIVAESDPDAEQRECEAKAGALVAAARDALARATEPII